MADAPITDQEIAILCDVLEGWGTNLNADKRMVLDQLIGECQINCVWAIRG